MIRGNPLDATIVYQARERSLQGPVTIRSFGLTVDFPARRNRLRSGPMHVTGVTNFTVQVTCPVVANQIQRLSAAPHERQTTRKIQIVIHILSLVDPVDRPVLRHEVEIPLPVPTRPFQPTGTGILHLLGGLPHLVERIVRQQQVSHRSPACHRRC